MEPSLRPDLSKILPTPWVRQLAARGAPLPNLQQPVAGEASADFLVEVTRRHELAADDVGFGLSQARAVAANLRARWQRDESPPLLHRPDPARVQRLLDRDGT